MLAVVCSLVAAGASVASLLVVRQMKRDQKAALAALKPVADGIAAANRI